MDPKTAAPAELERAGAKADSRLWYHPADRPLLWGIAAVLLMGAVGIALFSVAPTPKMHFERQGNASESKEMWAPYTLAARTMLRRSAGPLVACYQEDLESVDLAFTIGPNGKTSQVDALQSDCATSILLSLDFGPPPEPMAVRVSFPLDLGGSGIPHVLVTE